MSNIKLDRTCDDYIEMCAQILYLLLCAKHYKREKEKKRERSHVFND